MFIGIAAADSKTPQLEVLDKLCEIVDANFFDADLKGVDWSAACSRLRVNLPLNSAAFRSRLKALMGSLNTSHTAYYEAGEPEHAILLDVYHGNPSLVELLAKQPDGAPRLEFVGFFTTEHDGRYFIDQIVPGSSADTNGLLTGDEIVSVAGKRFDSATVFAGHAGNAIEIGYRRERNGAVQTVNVQAVAVSPLSFLDQATKKSVRIIEKDGLRIGFIRYWSFAGVEPTKIFLDALRPGGKLDGVDALIIDARARIGGGVLPLQLLKPQMLKTEGITRSGAFSQSPQQLADRFVMIIDGHTRSAAEMMAYSAKVHRTGILVGQTTQGALTGGTVFPLPNGAIVYVAVASVKYGGQVFEGRGVSPDIPVTFDLPYSADTDPLYERALA
ncbi:MAG: hypothetical protein GY761_17770 [Hyphomicrobiales bacterium]|nr:hypothetical protein [Hyphomicrobiales bacterium]